MGLQTINQAIMQALSASRCSEVGALGHQGRFDTKSHSPLWRRGFRRLQCREGSFTAGNPFLLADTA
jgi:hypothetical protein